MITMPTKVSAITTTSCCLHSPIFQDTLHTYCNILSRIPDPAAFINMHLQIPGAIPLIRLQLHSKHDWQHNTTDSVDTIRGSPMPMLSTSDALFAMQSRQRRRTRITHDPSNHASQRTERQSCTSQRTAGSSLFLPTFNAKTPLFLAPLLCRLLVLNYLHPKLIGNTD